MSTLVIRDLKLSNAIETAWHFASTNDSGANWQAVMNQVDGMSKLAAQLGVTHETADDLFMLWAVAMRRSLLRGDA